MKTLTLNIKQSNFYIENYCAVLSFTPDDSDNPEEYLILTRPTSEINGGSPEENYEWTLSLNYEDDFFKLNSYEIISNKEIKFIFNNGEISINFINNTNFKFNIREALSLIFRENI